MARAVDAYSEYRAGFEIRTLRVCRRVLMFHRFDELGPTPCLVRSLDLDYAASQAETTQFAEVTYLAGATSRGYSRRSGELYDLTSLPAQSFWSWSRCIGRPRFNDSTTRTRSTRRKGSATRINGWTCGMRGSPASSPSRRVLCTTNLTSAAANSRLPVPSRRRHRSVAWEPRSCRSRISMPTEAANWSRAPLRCRGFELDEHDQWQPFTAFPQALTVDVAAPNVLHLDLDGDGRADIMVTEESAVRWYPSAGRDGYTAAETVPRARDEEQGPILLWREVLQRIFLADFSGDGLMDVVAFVTAKSAIGPISDSGASATKSR